MKGTQGKITIGNLFTFLLILYGAFFAFKYFGAKLEAKAIKNEIVNFLGATRGARFDENGGINAISDILLKHKVDTIEAPFVQIDHNTIKYSVKYSIPIDYIFFKKTETVDVVGEMDNYGI